MKKNLKNFFYNKKYEIFIIGFIIFMICFLSFPVNLFWDTGHYMSYVEILEGKLPFSTWDIVRGPVFPIIIFMSNFIFGKTSQGILLLSFIFYLFMLFFVKKILDKVLNKKDNKKIYAIVFLSIILNPIIFGYYHVLLTEFVAMTLSLIMCYFSYKWLSINFYVSKKTYILYSVIFIIMSILSWNLKQPYVTITIFPLIVATVVSIINNKSIFNIIQRILVLIFCISGVIFSIICWNQFLVSNNIDLNTDRNVTASLGKQLINGLNNYELILDKKSKIKFLNEEEKEKLNTKNYALVNVYNLKHILVDQKIISIDNLKNISTISAIKFIFHEIINHPILVIESYISNYLALADIYPKETDDGVVYTVNKKFNINYCHENCLIALKIKENQSNIAYMLDESYMRVKDYEQYNNSPILLKRIITILAPIFQFFYKVLIVLLPLFVLLTTISFAVNKKEKQVLNMLMILIWYSFLHLILHTITGACIDRYAAPIIITSIVSIILYFNFLIKKNIKICNNKKSSDGKM